MGNQRRNRAEASSTRSPWLFDTRSHCLRRSSQLNSSS
ncbi:unnamed protein product [Arabidopsis halleri]